MVTPPSPPPNQPRYSIAGIIIVAVLGLLVLSGIIGSRVDSGADAGSFTAIDATETIATPPLTTEPPAAEPGFGDSSFLVGSDVQRGTYRSTGGSSCYWERLSGLTGEFDDLLSNDNPDGQAHVEVPPTDVAFSTEDCGTRSRIG